MEHVEPFSVEAGDPFETDAMASALEANRAGSGWQQQPGQALLRQQHPSGLDLLLPLPENAAEAATGPVVGLAELGHARIAPGNGGSSSSSLANASASALQKAGQYPHMLLSRSSYETDGSRRASSSSSSSSGASVAADHGLPGSTNIGGYIGGNDALGNADAAIEESEQYIRQYGLEVDGAMMLQNVQHSTEQLAGMDGIGGAGGSSGRLSQQGHYHSKHHGSRLGLSEQQQQELARKGSPQVESRLRHAVGGQQQQQQGVQKADAAAADAAAAGHDRAHAVATAATAAGVPHRQQQQQQQQVQHRHTEQHRQVVVVLEVEEDEDEEDEAAYLKQLSGARSVPDSAIGFDGDTLSPMNAADPQHQQQGAAGLSNPAAISLMSASSIASSVSSISSRGAGNTAFYARRGAGSGSSGAAYELFVRLNRARQTLDYAKRQAQVFAELDRAELGVWEALDLLNSMREYEAVLLAGSSSTRSSTSGGGGADGAGQQQQQQLGGSGAPLASQGSITEEPLSPDMPLKEHALQVRGTCEEECVFDPMLLFGLQIECVAADTVQALDGAGAPAARFGQAASALLPDMKQVSLY
jgi:hypothetical protein